MEFIVTIQEPEIQVVYVATQGEQGVAGLIWIDAGWTDATDYVVDNALEHNGSSYRAFVAHTSSAATEPGVGVDWETVWKILAEKGDTGSGGDMTKAVYDPGGVDDDAFDMDNMSETVASKVMTAAERDAIPLKVDEVSPITTRPASFNSSAVASSADIQSCTAALTLTLETYTDRSLGFQFAVMATSGDVTFAGTFVGEGGNTVLSEGSLAYVIRDATSWRVFGVSA